MTLQEELMKRMTAVKGDLQTEGAPLVNKVNISPNSWVDDLLDKAIDHFRMGPSMRTAASTSPLTGDIAYNPEVVKNLNDFELGDILTHELTHSKQTLDQPLLKRLYNMYFRHNYPYGQEPDELEAYQVERDRALKQGRPPMPSPNFSGPGMRKQGDIELKPVKKGNKP